MTDVTSAVSGPEASAAQTVLSDGIGKVEIECPVTVKAETEQPRDCLICATRTDDQWYDIFWTETRSGHSPLVAYICRVAEVRLASGAETGGVACRTCVELINVLERAELEYYRLKDSFVAIITDNPSFERTMRDVKHVDVHVELVKREEEEEAASAPASRTRTRNGPRARSSNSDDEPLALRKKRGRKPGKRKKETKEEVDASALEDMTRDEDSYAHRQNQRYPSPPSPKNETELSGDDFGWADDAVESVDIDYEPAKKKVTSKRKGRSIENGQRQKRSETKTKPMSVSIPVLGEVPSHLVLRGTQKRDAKLGEAGDRAKIKEQKRRKYNKSQPKVVYPCKECPATFNSLSRLTYHMAKHEASKAPFICEICGAHYKHKKACDIHVAMHKGISDWKCEECNKLFPSKGALHRHNAIHTGKPNYQCDLCGKSFIHTSSFKMHKLSHTGVKPHACDVCGLALMTRSHLKRHKRIHSGEKRHECPVCGKRFSERYNLLAHQKSHEGGSPVAPGQAPPRKTWHGFRCYLCDKRFERRYMLEKHMEVVHQRIMEKGPPKPRNTMTKLLKAQAAAVGKPSARPDAGDQSSSHEQGSAQAQTESEVNAAEDSSLDVKPHIAKPDIKEAGDGDADKSPQHTATRPTTIAAGEAYETLRLVNGAWSSGPYVATEYSMRISEYPQ